MTSRDNKTARSQKIGTARSTASVNRQVKDQHVKTTGRGEMDDNKSARSSARSVILDPMTGLPKFVQDPFSGEEMEANPSTGRYSSRSK